MALNNEQERIPPCPGGESGPYGAFGIHFRTLIVKISKLISEVWLYEETADSKKYADGALFLSDLEKGKTVREALYARGINISEEVVTPILDPQSYCGAILPDVILDAALNQPIRFVWKIPFAPRPTTISLPTPVLEQWILTCENWLNNPYDTKLPAVPNMFVPLTSC